MTAVLPGERVLHVALDVFDGPLDLLLTLVREQRLDVRTVCLARVAEQYFAYLGNLQDLGVESAAEYLVIAATLVFLKSKSLLPPLPNDLVSEGEETAEEAEERLRARLIAYWRYRDAARVLRDRAARVGGSYFRSCGDPQNDLVQRYRFSLDRLPRAMERVLRALKPERRTILRERYSVARQLGYVLRTLRGFGSVSFSVMCGGFDRGRMIATFLAVLDLLRLQRIRHEQLAFDAPLVLHPAPGETA